MADALNPTLFSKPVNGENKTSTLEGIFKCQFVRKHLVLKCGVMV